MDEPAEAGHHHLRQVLNGRCDSGDVKDLERGRERQPLTRRGATHLAAYFGAGVKSCAISTLSPWAIRSRTSTDALRLPPSTWLR